VPFFIFKKLAIGVIRQNKKREGATTNGEGAPVGPGQRIVSAVLPPQHLQSWG